MNLAVIDNQLRELRLAGIRQTIETRLKNARSNNTSFEELVSLLLQDEVDHKKSSKIVRLIKRATFRQPASLESLDLKQQRGLDAKQISELQSCRYVDDGLNIIIMGPTGVGKTYLATALGNAACRQGRTCHFFRMNALMEQILLARAKNSYLAFLKKLERCDLLILDDFGIKRLQPAEFQDLFDVIDERGEQKSTIITTQLPVENWNEVIGDPVTCEALTDRLSASAIKIVMDGPSYRQKRKPRPKGIDTN